MSLRKGVLAFTLAAALLQGSADAATFTVTNNASSGAGSLAAAIQAANATTAADSIVFSIPGETVHSISGALPAITHPLTIDGYTQPGSSVNPGGTSSTAVILIEIDGSERPAGSPVLRISSDKVVVRGLAIGGIPKAGFGILVDAGSVIVTIEGNFIGTDASGTEDRSSGTGIVNFGSATIGGDSSSEENLISGNTTGIVQRGANSSISRNTIGLDATGIEPLPNGTGISVETAAAIDIEIERNQIARNTGTAISVSATAPGPVVIRLNSISDNGGLGIDLGADGVTPNDPADADEGPNGLQNAPEVQFYAVSDERTVFELRLESEPGTYRIELFENEHFDDSEHGEGERMRAVFEVTIPEGETAVGFRIEPANRAFEHPYPTMTATGPKGTSEFSRVVERIEFSNALAVTHTGSSGPGSLRAAVDSANAGSDLDLIYFDIPDVVPGPYRIFLDASMELSQPVILDGYSQEGSHSNTRSDETTDASIQIILDGVAMPPNHELSIDAVGCIVRGLSIVRMPMDGLVLYDADETRIEGNFIGVDPDGLEAMPNGFSGVLLSDRTNFASIGGLLPAQRNILSANLIHGVNDDGRNTGVAGNLIGADRDGGATLGNGGAGVFTTGGPFRVGEYEGGDNLITANVAGGIQIHGDGDTFGNVFGNRIRGNGGLGIDLISTGENAGVTPNDAGDTDDGPNDLQNFPVLTRVESNLSSLTVQGFLHIDPALVNIDFMIQVYGAIDCDETQHGEGDVYLGREILAGAEAAAFDISLPVGGTVPRFVVATATADNRVSEFSRCYDLLEVCGDASGDGEVQIGDALFVLKAAVGTASCSCRCDVDSSSSVTVSDALLVLRASVGQQVELACPFCPQ
jgi:hypothetical protein